MSVYADLKMLTSDARVAGVDYLERTGIDIEGVMLFCAEDARDTVENVLRGMEGSVPPEVLRELGMMQPATKIALVGLLAMHEQVGIILGMRLVREVGR